MKHFLRILFLVVVVSMLLAACGKQYKQRLLLQHQPQPRRL